MQLVRRHFAHAERFSGVPGPYIVPVIVAGIALQSPCSGRTGTSATTSTTAATRA
jgi:hypothetical protein